MLWFKNVSSSDMKIFTNGIKILLSTLIISFFALNIIIIEKIIKLFNPAITLKIYQWNKEHREGSIKILTKRASVGSFFPVEDRE